MVWKTLDDQFDPAFDEFTKWGVQGLKIDFMQRDDQKLITFYYKASREAASNSPSEHATSGIAYAASRCMAITWLCGSLFSA